MPTELFTMKPDGTDLKQLTHFNDARVKNILRPPAKAAKSSAPRAPCTFPAGR